MLETSFHQTQNRREFLEEFRGIPSVGGTLSILRCASWLLNGEIRRAAPIMDVDTFDKSD